jgi:alkanesulfonate monooxygenase SsuD/methylene tetrahydromethanopterin reductase-like flavin-dependent oxidoreductase (luciferase family)
MVNINDDRDVAYAESLQFFDRYYGAGTVSPEFVSDWLAYGRPADVIEKIQGFIDAGMTTIIIRFTTPAQRQQLERCLDEVLPGVRRLTPGLLSATKRSVEGATRVPPV